MKSKHDCQEWADEGRGCSICSRLHLSTKKLKEVQEHINWRILELNKRIAQLENERLTEEDARKRSK